MGAVDVAREHQPAEPVVGAVGERDRFVLVGEADDRQHRPEDLALGEVAGVVDIAEHGGSDEVPVRQLAAKRSPPVSSVAAPLDFAASITPRMRSQLAASITGPICTPSSNGRPTLSACAIAVTVAATSS